MSDHSILSPLHFNDEPSLFPHQVFELNSPKLKKPPIINLDDEGNRVSQIELDIIKEQSMMGAATKKKQVAFRDESDDQIKIIQTFIQTPENYIP